MQETNERRIVLLGKTGSGKSSLGNTIMKNDFFKVSDSPNSETQKCLSKSEKMNGKYIKLIDTPGVFDTDPTSPALSPEIVKCMRECYPGAHAFLLVLKVERYTRQEQAVVDIILKYFSAEALKYTTVVFTRGEDLRGMKIKDWVNQNEALSSLVRKCGGRCHVFDNTHWNNSQDPYKNNQVQATELLRTIEETVKNNGGGCYTSEMLQNVRNDELVRVPVGIALGAMLGGCLAGFAGVPVGVIVGGFIGAWISKNPMFLNDLENLYKQFQKTNATDEGGSWCKFM